MTITIKQFINEYKHCPFCNDPLTMESAQADKLVITNNKLTISMKSDYFIDPSRNVFEFSISIINGNILHTDSANQYISLYDFDIYIKKYCKSCNPNNFQSFSRCIKIFYDREQSSFTAEPYIERFSFTYNNIYYIFVNNYYARTSMLVCHPDMQGVLSPANIAVKTPYLSFNKLDFNNKEKLISKFNSILLLT